MNDDKKYLKEVLGVYEELKGVLESMREEGTWFDDHGFAKHADSVIDRIGKVCPEIEDIQSYRTVTRHSSQRGLLVQTIPTKAKYKSLLGRIKGFYGLDSTETNSGNIFVQNQTQSQSQTLTMILSLQEKIIQEIPKHEEGSKERKFLEKIKDSLSVIKDTKDILETIIRTGAEFGLSAITISKLLNL